MYATRMHHWIVSFERFFLLRSSFRNNNSWSGISSHVIILVLISFTNHNVFTYVIILFLERIPFVKTETGLDLT